jgi:uncharacterized protein YkwD
VIAAVLSLLLAAGHAGPPARTPTRTPTPTRSPTPAPATPLESAASALSVINAARARAGVAPLAESAALDRVAQGSADRVANARTADEAEDAGKDVGERAEKAGYAHRRVGEIVMMGDGALENRLARLRDTEPETFADVVAPDYRDFGFGLVETEAGTVRVLVFGLSLSDEFGVRSAALADLKSVRADMIRRVNGARAAKGLPPLLENPSLDAAAQRHAEDMIRRSYYAHESPEGATVMERVRSVGYAAAAVGENIAEGQSTVAEVFDGWMKSPRHREHILSFTLREIGVGMAFGRNARGYEIVWVQDFATPR